jgi:hypothetical protein
MALPNDVERYREVYNRPGLENDPHRGALLWDSKGISADAAGQNVYNYFQRTAGREPTASELAQFVPIYQGSYTHGNAAISGYLDMESRRPGNMAEKAPEYSDEVQKVFREMLGRDAREDELQHFGSKLATKDVDAYGLRNFLKGSEEYQAAEDTKFRSGLSSELQGYDTSFFDKAKENVLSRFANSGTLGGSARSSALDFALTDLMGQIAEKRGSYLADLSSRQYAGNKDLAISNYRGGMDRYLDDMDAQRDRGYQNIDRSFGRAQELEDYNRQMNDFRSMGSRRREPWGQIVGGTLGSIVGGVKGGPQGANAGWQVGSGIGGGFDYLSY